MENQLSQWLQKTWRELLRIILAIVAGYLAGCQGKITFRTPGIEVQAEGQIERPPAQIPPTPAEELLPTSQES